MWAHAFDLLQEAEALHRQFFRLGAAPAASAPWEPPIDVFEDERELVVVVAMPGVPADRVQVVVEPGAVVVRGTRPLPCAEGGHRMRRLEIPYGAFERRIAVAGRFEAGSPELTHGCLVVRLRKVMR
jgi:HSP20 family molecular chaperone IbpA